MAKYLLLPKNTVQTAKLIIKSGLAPGADFGEGRGGGDLPTPPLKDSTPCRPKGSPLCTILRYPNLVMNPKIFLKAPVYTYFEWGARAKKMQFFWSNVLKST